MTSYPHMLEIAGLERASSPSFESASIIFPSSGESAETHIPDTSSTVFYDSHGNPIYYANLPQFRPQDVEDMDLFFDGVVKSILASS